MSVAKKPGGWRITKRPARITTRVKTTIVALTAVVTLATGVLTLRDQLFKPEAKPAPENKSSLAAAITNDAEAKSWANRVSDGLKACVANSGRDYEGCDTGGILGALNTPIGYGVGSVEVDVTSPATFELISRSRSGHLFRLQNFVSGEQVRTCTPPGAGGCPDDGRW